MRLSNPGTTTDWPWSYVWDAENRLIQMSVNTSVGPQYQLNFAYDYRGRRVQKTVAISGIGEYTNNFLYDGWNLIAALSLGSQMQSAYVWGNDLSGSQQGAGGVGGLLEVINCGAATNFVAFDGNGNVAALVNAVDGTMAANYEYGPFGEPIRMTGSQAAPNPFRFSTKYDDDESDLLFYGYRYYKPSTGTWVSRDPIGEKGGKNLYEFAKGNPISSVDYLGLSYSWTTLKDPFGFWGLRLDDLPFNPRYYGFLSQYFPLGPGGGKCHVAKNIVLVQVIRSNAHINFGAYFFDAEPPGSGFGGLPPHSPTDPPPGYYSQWTSPPHNQLRIQDAPDSSLYVWHMFGGIWNIIDYAVDREVVGANTIDYILGTVSFTFERDDSYPNPGYYDASVSIVGGATLVKKGDATLIPSASNIKPWEAALRGWQK